MPLADLLRKLTTSAIPQAKQGYDLMADQVDPGPSLDDADHPYKAMARGGIAGLLNGLGNVADQTTSPLGLASLAVGNAGGGASRGMFGKLLSMVRPAATVGAEGAEMAPGITAAARTAGSAVPIEDQLFLENMRRQQLSNRLSPYRFGQTPPTRDEMVDMLARGTAARGR